MASRTPHPAPAAPADARPYTGFGSGLGSGLGPPKMRIEMESLDAGPFESSDAEAHSPWTLYLASLALVLVAAALAAYLVLG